MRPLHRLDGCQYSAFVFAPDHPRSSVSGGSSVRARAATLALRNLYVTRNYRMVAVGNSGRCWEHRRQVIGPLGDTGSRHAAWREQGGLHESAIHPPRTASGVPRRFEALRTLAVTTLYCRGQEICSQGEPADHWFWIIAGSARRSVIRPDGRRQIVDLLLPDDCFGFTNGARI